MIKKIKLLVLFLFISIVLCIILIIKNAKNNEYKQVNNNKGITNEYVKQFRDNWEILVDYFLSGLIDYDDMPLSNNFIEKYPKLESIIKFKSIRESADLVFDIPKDSNNVMTIRCKTGNGLEQIAYMLRYIINDKNELDDIEILDTRIYENSNGEYLHYVKYHYYYDEPSIVTAALCYPYVSKNKEDEFYRVYVTKDFEKKFPEYLKFGITGDKDYIMYGDYYCDRNNRDVCYAEFLGLQWTKTYKLQYDIDDKGYVNDIDISLIEKKKTEDPQYVKNLYEEYLDNIDN